VNVNQIRRWTLTMWLRGVRLPLTVAETIFHRADDNGAWPPALAFEMFEGTVKDVVGRMTRDEVLVELAALQRAEVSERRRAVALDVEATSTSVAVREDADAEKARLAEQRKQAARRARDREARAEADRQEAKRAVDERSGRKRAAARATAATRAKATDREAASADAVRLRKKAQALKAKQKAVTAQGKVLDLDKAVRARKAARRTG
jgi:hypothetical protein